jgi:putative aminopeptidase FrvX
MSDNKGISFRTPEIGDVQISLLERLCNACAVSGDEAEVRAIVREHIQGYASEVHVDAMGNVLALCQGQGEHRVRVMVAAHMDEVGIMLTADEGGGLFRFEVVGGLDASQLAGKAMWVGRQHAPGVIGVKPVHFSEDKDNLKHFSIEELRLDVGPNNAAQAQIGDRATFSTIFSRLGDSLCAKALDDRLGVATLIELVRNAPPNIDLLAAFTVQEEIGLRGAGVAAYGLQPDLAFVLDCTPARDLSAWQRDDEADPHSQDQGVENVRYNTRLGAGPAIYVVDAATISDSRLVRHLVETAVTLGIPYQIRQPGGGGTDAGAIHRQRSGIPSVSVSVPGRYIHSPAGIVRLEDWKNELALAYTALARLTPDVLKVAN